MGRIKFIYIGQEVRGVIFNLKKKTVYFGWTFCWILTGLRVSFGTVVWWIQTKLNLIASLVFFFKTSNGKYLRIQWETFMERMGIGERKLTKCGPRILFLLLLRHFNFHTFTCFHFHFYTSIPEFSFFWSWGTFTFAFKLLHFHFHTTIPFLLVSRHFHFRF